MRAATSIMRVAGLVLAWFVILAGSMVVGLMIAFVVWDVARGRWVNLPFDVLFAALGAALAWVANRSRRGLVDSARR